MVARALDSLGKTLNRLGNPIGLNYATGDTRRRAVLFASVDSREISRSFCELRMLPTAKTQRAIDDYLHNKNDLTSLYKEAGISFNDRLLAKAQRMATHAVLARQADGKISDERALEIFAEMNSPSMREYLIGLEFQTMLKIPLTLPGLMSLFSFGVGEHAFGLALGLIDVTIM